MAAASWQAEEVQSQMKPSLDLVDQRRSHQIEVAEVDRTSKESEWMHTGPPSVH